MSQIALPLDWPDDSDATGFILDESNSAAVRHLDHWSLWPVRVSLLTGPRKSGRSTLARLFARKSGGRILDDADSADEEALFHAWNEAQADYRPLLLIANQPPPVWEIALPDLRSRMAATPKIAIYEPSDALIAARLRRHFAAHGGMIGEPAIEFALKRIERSHLALHRLIETAERMSIERQSAVSRNLVRDAMTELGFIDL